MECDYFLWIDGLLIVLYGGFFTDRDYFFRRGNNGLFINELCLHLRGNHGFRGFNFNLLDERVG